MLRGIFGQPDARVLPLKRRSKKPSAEYVVQSIMVGMINPKNLFEIYRVATLKFIWKLMYAALIAGIVGK